MNKRIEQLAEQAGFFPTELTQVGPSVEKFAQLIVRECVWVADTAEPYQTSDLILKHFGVEP